MPVTPKGSFPSGAIALYLIILLSALVNQRINNQPPKRYERQETEFYICLRK
ncbi:hypothetical protein HUN01_00825 (plasmid) [Nostoc edaphicum CCNP1411]|uniref:Uncharacterized protein n=2 Tax=Nostoc TaxID=1177 RepID=A0A7D7QHF2_9NOSO|nr:hypothetical protein [Nostoc edaphicum]QMS86204.1 hypothetical protein HUN01_00825 [Nostoc edaphicum CCNP1411]